MKLTEALEIARARHQASHPPFRILFACGFTPLHARTFLAAHLQNRLPERLVKVDVGLYGNLDGTIASLPLSDLSAAAIALEWSDLDPRLGFRQLGGWTPHQLEDIVASAAARLEWLRHPLSAATAKMPVAVSLPTLPLPPLFFQPGWHAGRHELALRESVQRFAGWAGTFSNLRIMNPQRLDELSPPSDRYDCQSDLLTGFPYTKQHADVMGELMASLIASRVPKKGLITDLDNTLWKGIVGEIGAQNVSWDLASHSQLHGIYQQLLSSFAEAGVLLAVASKNEPGPVEETFARTDVLLSRERCYPVETHWKPKSESVGRILRAWNIGPDSVVFVDDSPMELAEVSAAHPQIECIRFPAGDYAAAPEFFRKLRDLFGKISVSAEDAVRLESIRAAALRESGAPANGASLEAFLEKSDASVRVSYAKFPPDARAFELINKTNQFNLNGRRYSEADWAALLRAPDSFLQVVSYDDKYGPLGKVAVIAGRRCADQLHVQVWVMSCRAFGRRIEHQCLKLLFENFDVHKIAFDFIPTPKNGPLREFLSEYCGGGPAACLSRDAFRVQCPPLFHRTEYTFDESSR